LKEEEDALADQITSTDDCRKMFRTAKQLRSTKPTPPIIDRDTDGNLMGTDKRKAKTTKDWFQQPSTDQQDELLQPFEGAQRTLHIPITEEEVKTAITAFQNGISSVLFTCYLAAALQSFQESSNKYNPPPCSLGLPLEIE